MTYFVRSILIFLTLGAAATHAQAVLIHNPRLSVVADGVYKQVPDIAKLRIGVSNRANDAKTALAENSMRMNQVVALIDTFNIEKRDIQTQRISLQPQFQHQRDSEPVLKGYVAKNRITLTLRDIALVGEILDVLVGAGANEIDGPYFEVAEPEQAHDLARLSALNTARQRAQQYADALGLAVAGIISMDEGGGFKATQQTFEMNSVVSFSAKSATAPSIEPGENVYRARLNVVFELEGKD